MRLIMMGTGPFGVPTFRALLDSPHTVTALVTQPARPTRGHKPAPVSAIRALAQERGVPIMDPESINTDEVRAELAALNADLFIVIDYGQILKPETIATTRLGGINLHGSLLPKYRGAAPINWAIYHGDTETGVTVLHVTPTVDAGPCLAQGRTPIGPDDTAVEIEHRLAELGAPLVCQTIERLTVGDTSGIVQDPQQVTGARRLRKEDGEIDWQRGAEAIRNQIRAFEPWPRCSTTWHRPGAEPMRLILGRTHVESTATDAANSAAPGTVLVADKSGLVIATGQGALTLDEVQPAGKRMMSASEFLRGHGVLPGHRFGPAV